MLYQAPKSNWCFWIQQTSSYLACAMLSVSPKPPRGFRSSLEQATKRKPLYDGLSPMATFLP